MSQEVQNWKAAADGVTKATQRHTSFAHGHQQLKGRGEARIRMSWLPCFYSWGQIPESIDKQGVFAQISGPFRVHLVTMLIRVYDNRLNQLYNRTLCGRIVKIKICFLV